jgi:autotransporter adhesin
MSCFNVTLSGCCWISRRRPGLARFFAHSVRPDIALEHRYALCLAVGALSLAAAPGAAGCNSGNVAMGSLLNTADCQAKTTGNLSTSVGKGSEAGPSGTAVGDGAKARRPYATAVGASAGLAGDADGATSIGAAALALGSYATATGFYAAALGRYSIAIGGGDAADFTPTIGPTIKLNGAQASGFISTAVGTASQATGGGSSAFGLASKATGDNSSAYGEFSKASGESSVAVGLFSVASGVSSIALGRQAIATKTRSVAIGDGSVANRPDTVSVGTTALRRRIVNVAAAVGPADAVNLAQAQALATAAAASARVASPPNGDTAMSEELAAVRALAHRLEARIAQLEGNKSAAVAKPE